VTSYYASDPTEIRLSVSAVVWRADAGRELLLMQRSDNGHWGLPGGYVEIGESVAAACAREVLEETGVHVAVGRLIGVYSDPARQVIDYGEGRRVHAVNLCFEARATGSGEATTPHETLATGYFAAGALPAPLVPIHEIRIRDALTGAPSAAVR
jgi:ADP-ribose pyrophosphatase YjhB (NUDIX family)